VKPKKNEETPTPREQLLYCALYARVSSEDQGERYSLPSQLRALRAKAASAGYAVRDDLTFIDKITGKSVERPEFDRLRRMAGSGAFRAVFILCVDRLSRNVVDAIKVRREFKKQNVLLDFVEQKIEDTPQGDLTFNMCAVIAEFNGANILQNAMRGMKEKAEQGFIPCGPAPYGYRLAGRTHRNEGRTLVIDEKRAPIVRRIFEKLASGRYSLYEIAQLLNEDGIPSPNGQEWCRSIIHRIVHNETYMGRRIFAKGTLRETPIPVPAIVEPSLFAAANAQHRRNRAARVGRPSLEYLLRGLLWCQGCGHRCTAIRIGRYSYYRCGNRDVSRRAKRLCSAPGIAKERLEQVCLEAIREVLTDPQELESRIAKACEQAGNGKQEERRLALEKQLTAARAKESHTRKVMLDPKLANEYSEFRQEYLQAKEHRMELEAKLAALRLIPMPSKRSIADLTREFRAGLENLETYSFEQRRGILVRAVERIWYNNGKARIRVKLDVPKTPPNASVSVQKNCPQLHATGDNSFQPITIEITRQVA
jgi:DNA invertase Pin-like site-specific DNA recombinase